MRHCLWLPALLGLTVAVPATSQQGLRIGESVAAALTAHRSVVEAEAAVRSAALALRLAEIDRNRVAVSLTATPSAGIDLGALQGGALRDLADTFDADGSAMVSAAFELPWGMNISGSYTAELHLDGRERDGERLVDVHSVSVAQDLLPEGSLSATALALAGRGDELRLARIRRRRVQSEVGLQAARTFLSLTERARALALLEQRLELAERDLAHTRSLVAQHAASQLDLLNATIAATERRNAVADTRATLTLDTTRFFTDLDLAPATLLAPAGDVAELRRIALALLAAPAPQAALGNALAVLEAEAALTAAELQAERAQRGELPELSLSLDYRKPRSQPGLGSLSLSLTGSYTLFDGGRHAVSVEQAQAQVAAARRSVAAARTDAEGAFERSRLELRRAVAAEELAALQVERARLDLEQAVRRHNAGAISATALEEAALLLREAEGNARAAAHALGSAYLSLAVDLGFDLPQQLAAIAR